MPVVNSALPAHGLLPPQNAPLASSPASVAPSSSPETGIHFDTEYKLKQYGSDALLTGGTIAAGVFIFAPEPIVTKIIGGSIALACVAAAGASKHYMYRSAYVSKALESAIVKLQGQVKTLKTQIRILELTSLDLAETNDKLKVTGKLFTRQVASLQGQVGKLESELSEAFTQLNKDRASFEEEKATKLSQLTDEIQEADARGDRAEKRLIELDDREESLNSLSRELQGRREHLATAESELRSMQLQLLEVCADNPELLEKLPKPSPKPSVTVAEVQTDAEVSPKTQESSLEEPSESMVNNLKALASLAGHRGAKVHVDDEGLFDLQEAGFFSQSVTRSFQNGATVTSHKHFFLPVFEFFNDAKSQFQTCEIQQAFNGLCSMRRTYQREPEKAKVLRQLVRLVQANNPELVIPPK